MLFPLAITEILYSNRYSGPSVVLAMSVGTVIDLHSRLVSFMSQPDYDNDRFYVVISLNMNYSIGHCGILNSN